MIIQSKEYNVAASSTVVFEKLSNLENLKPLAEHIQDDKITIEIIDSTHCRVTADGGLSALFEITESIPNERITLISSGQGLPISGKLTISLKGLNEETRLSTTLDADVPIFLRGMAKPMMQQAAEKLGETLSKVPYNA